MAAIAPIPLAPDNFTELTRTPWAGERIIRRFKQGLIAESLRPADDRVGESWEFSAGAEYPSRCEATGRPLSERLIANPTQMLGEEASDGGTSLLVKLLDAREMLSVQIHPGDDYAGLGRDECGKPECWYILDHDPGSGIFLGLAAGIDRRAVEEAMAGERDFRNCLRFIEVQAGDFFLVEAGTPHAVGPGVLLLEPQQVHPARKGVTYRYWDWDRRYDADGHPSSRGELRPLHRANALAVTNWDAPMDDARLGRSMLRAGPPPKGEARLTQLGGEAGLASAHLRVARLGGSGRLALPGWPAVCALTILEGRIRRVGDRSEWWQKGRTVAIPSALSAEEIELEDAHAVLSATRKP